MIADTDSLLAICDVALVANSGVELAFALGLSDLLLRNTCLYLPRLPCNRHDPYNPNPAGASARHPEIIEGRFAEKTILHAVWLLIQLTNWHMVSQRVELQRRLLLHLYQPRYVA
jgi:hypothetical protein